MKQFYKYIAITFGILLSINLVPKVEKLYADGMTSTFGISEAVVVLTHFILGFTTYFIFVLFEKNKYVYLLVFLLILYLGLLDYQMYLHGTGKVITGLVVMRIFQISLLFCLHRVGFIKFNLLICLSIYVLLLFWGNVFGFRFYSITNVLG